MRKIRLITLGCSKNLVDSEHLLRQIARFPFDISVSDGDLSRDGVDTVILNTCGFIKDAKEESIEAIMRAVDAKIRGYIRHIYVFGCLSQRYGEELHASIPEVDGFFGAFDQESVLKALGIASSPLLATERYLTTPGHYAYLKISEGCDRHCAYCAIPNIRGRHVSVPMDELLREAEWLASKGVRELIVIAQDTTWYGLDLYGRRMLGTLLERLSRIEGIEWIRVHYSYPDGFPDDVLEQMAFNPKVCKYIDIPLQHSSDKVLAMMRRNITGAQTRALVEKFREKVPGVVLRTTLIVGHPGEGARDFRDLMQFVSDCRFERLGAFTYSREEGTWAAMNYRNSVPERVKRERYEQLMELQSAISLECNRRRVGTVERVLADSFTDGVLVTRSQSESPEVDGEILVGGETFRSGFAPASLIGKFMDVRITGADEYDLLAEL